MMLICALVYLLILQFNIFGISFRHKDARTTETPVLPQEKPAPVENEENQQDMFAYQIKKAEMLYNPIILEAANLHDVDLTMVKAIIMAESGYNKKSVSRNGAVGLMQLMPRTARSLGVKDIFNPEENIHAGVRYFKTLLNRFKGDEKLALAAYNAGARNVYKYKGIPPFRETRRYIRKVLAYQQFYKHGPASQKTTSL